MSAIKSSEMKITQNFEIEFDIARHINGLVRGMSPGMITNGRIPNVKLSVALQSATCAGYIAALPDMIKRARVAGAEMLLDRSIFSDDREFTDAVGILSAQLTPVNAVVAGQDELKRYVVDATYHQDGDPFGDAVMAKDEAEAEFLIRWTMTENAGYEVSDDAERFAQVMAKHSIRDIQIETVSPDTLKSLLANLIVEAQSSGHSGPALDAAREAAETLGLDLTSAPTPKI